MYLSQTLFFGGTPMDVNACLPHICVYNVYRFSSLWYLLLTAYILCACSRLRSSVLASASFIAQQVYSALYSYHMRPGLTSCKICLSVHCRLAPSSLIHYHANIPLLTLLHGRNSSLLALAGLGISLSLTQAQLPLSGGRKKVTEGTATW